MSSKDFYENEYLDRLARDLPENAFLNNHQLNTAWLESASEDLQITAICQWFSTQFCDPAENTPFASEEGGYLWIDGGPYNARNEIEYSFSQIVPEKTIDKAIDIVESTGIDEWAPLYYLEPIDDLDIPLVNLQANVFALQKLTEVEMPLVNNLVFSALIGAFETFLWETMRYAINDMNVVMKLLSMTEFNSKGNLEKLFQFQQLKIADFLTLEAKKLLNGIVWHKIGTSTKIFKTCLDYEIQLEIFTPAIRKRHDIVHRLNKTVDKKEVNISTTEINDLANKIVHCAEKINKGLSSKLKR